MRTKTPAHLIILAACFGLLASLAVAHSPLQATTPAAGASLPEAPDSIEMVFNGPLRLTRVSLAGGDMAADLDLSAYGGFVTDYSLPLSGLAAGSYTVVWRGLGADGHIQTGDFSFTVN